MSLVEAQRRVALAFAGYLLIALALVSSLSLAPTVLVSFAPSPATLEVLSPVIPVLRKLSAASAACGVSDARPLTAFRILAVMLTAVGTIGALLLARPVAAQATRERITAKPMPTAVLIGVTVLLAYAAWVLLTAPPDCRRLGRIDPGSTLGVFMHMTAIPFFLGGLAVIGLSRRSTRR